MIEIYYNENSVCSERVLMTLAEKGVGEWTGRHLDLFEGEQADPEYVALNPKAQVPTLVHDGQVVRESSIICDYLDDLYPENPLKPVGNLDRAHMREWIKESDEAGFQGVGALSFTAVFREKLANKTEAERQKLWAEQTDLSRTYRQKSCFNEGLQSPYAIIAIAAWDRIFGKLDAALSDGRSWIMGDQFTLADLNFAPLVARLEAIGFLQLWLDGRTPSLRWWQRIKARASFAAAHVGVGSTEEREEFAREGRKIVTQASQILAELS